MARAQMREPQNEENEAPPPAEEQEAQETLRLLQELGEYQSEFEQFQIAVE